jgi:LysM repeat protein
VRRGETLWEVSQRYNLRLTDLLRWNGMLANDVLRIGQRLRIAPPPNQAR